MQKIRRDVGTKVKLTETQFCPMHLRESEIKKGLGGKMSVDITAVPSKFAWLTSPRKRPPPSARFSPKKGKHRLEESFTVSSDITSEADATVFLETAVFRFPLGLSKAAWPGMSASLETQCKTK